MSSKHFTFAADSIVDYCFMNGIKKEDSEIYNEYLKFFKYFGISFSQETFDNYIDNKLEEYK